MGSRMVLGCDIKNMPHADVLPGFPEHIQYLFLMVGGTRVAAPRFFLKRGRNGLDVVDLERRPSELGAWSGPSGRCLVSQVRSGFGSSALRNTEASGFRTMPSSLE